MYRVESRVAERREVSSDRVSAWEGYCSSRIIKEGRVGPKATPCIKMVNCIIGRISSDEEEGGSCRVVLV